jgi:hypothetical protein
MHDIAPLLRGYVTVSNGAGLHIAARNLVVYTGGDIIAKLLGGQTEYNISHMYFAFENTVGTPTPPVPARTDTAASAFHSLVSPRDFIRAAVLVPPAFSASDGDHSYNRATFTAIATAAAGVNGVPFGSSSNSQIYAMGLVAAPTGAYAGDILYAHFALPTSLPVAGSGQVSATWMTEAD